MSNSAFGFKTSDASPGFVFWKSTLTWQRLVKRSLDNFGISHAQFVILAVLLWDKETNQDPNQTTIVKKSNLDKMTISNSLRSLAALGLVSRLEDEHDTRAKSVRLTEKGLALATRLVPIVEAVDDEFFGVLPAELKKSLIHALQRLSTTDDHS
jgi:MarR family transcriptional regulator, organic hydroperoxide resistance regulator